MSDAQRITALASLGLIDRAAPSRVMAETDFRAEHERHAPAGPAATKALLFGRRLPFHPPSFVVPTLSWQWGKRAGSTTMERLFTPTGQAKDALPSGAEQQWLAERPPGLRAIRLATQHALNHSADRPWWNPEQDGFYAPARAYLERPLGADLLLWDDETRLDPGERSPEFFSRFSIDDICAEADFSASERADLLAGKLRQGAARENSSLWRLNDVLHRRVADQIAIYATFIGARIVASNHGACLPCVYPSYHAGQYNQSPAGCGAPIPGGFSSVKCYGGSWSKPGVWYHNMSRHELRPEWDASAGVEAYAAGQLALAHLRLASTELASRQPRAVWLQCRDDNAWMLTPAGYETMLHAVLSTVGGGVLIVSQEGSTAEAYSRKWYDQLGRAIDEVNSQLDGRRAFVDVPSVSLEWNKQQYTLSRTAKVAASDFTFACRDSYIDGTSVDGAWYE